MGGGATVTGGATVVEAELESCGVEFDSRTHFLRPQDPVRTKDALEAGASREHPGEGTVLGTYGFSPLRGYGQSYGAGGAGFALFGGDEAASLWQTMSRFFIFAAGGATAPAVLSQTSPSRAMVSSHASFSPAAVQ